MPFLTAAVLLVGAYLYASIPFVYALGRWHGIDLSRVNTRNVGGSNLWQTAGPAVGLGGGLLDVSKGAFPPLAAAALGLGAEAMALAATLGLVGQCWPLFGLLRGGRGNSALIGAALAVLPRESAIAVVPLLVGWLMRRRMLSHNADRGDGVGDTRSLEPMSRSVPLGMIIGFGLLPLLAMAFGEPAAYDIGFAAGFGIVLLRRVTAELAQDMRLPSGRGRVLLSRLLYDRPQP